MFDRHQAEITVIQFTGHSLPVHQSMTVPQDFTLSHFVSQAHPRQWNMHFRYLWNGMFGRVKGQYTTIVISAGNGPGDPSSNPSEAVCISHSTNTRGKCMNSILLSPGMCE